MESLMQSTESLASQRPRQLACRSSSSLLETTSTPSLRMHQQSRNSNKWLGSLTEPISVRSLCGQSGVITTHTLTGRMNCYSPWSKASGSCLHSTTPSWCRPVRMVSSSECYSLTQCLWSAQITRLRRFRCTS